MKLITWIKLAKTLFTLLIDAVADFSGAPTPVTKSHKVFILLELLLRLYLNEQT